MEYLHRHKNITSYFNYHFPLHQNQSWKEYRIPAKVASRVISLLRGDQLLIESLRKMTGLGRSIGVTGTITAKKVEHSHTLTQSSHVNKQSSSQHSPPECAPGITFKEIRYAFNMSRMRSLPSTRPSSWLWNKAPFTKQRENKFFPLTRFTNDSEDNIPRQSLSLRYPRRSQKWHSSWPISQETPRYRQHDICQSYHYTTS